MRDAFDVETARGDVGGHQHGMLARAEPFDRRQPLLLGAVRVERRGTNALADQRARQPVRVNLAAHEHQHRSV